MSIGVRWFPHLLPSYTAKKRQTRSSLLKTAKEISDDTNKYVNSTEIQNQRSVKKVVFKKLFYCLKLPQYIEGIRCYRKKNGIKSLSHE
jgi:hypothetical protein